MEIIRGLLERWVERRKLRREIAEEFGFHLEQIEAENHALGMAPHQARRAAAGRFGNPRAIARECQRIAESTDNRLPRTSRHDLVFSLPAAAAASVLVILALAFEFLPHHLGKLPYRDPGRLVVSSGCLLIRTSAAASAPPQAQNRRPDDEVAIADTARFRRMTMDVAGRRESSRTFRGMAVSPGFFRVLGVSPLYGELAISPSAGDRVVVSHRLWMTQLSGDPGVIGKPLSLNGSNYTVAAVMPAEFWFLHPGDAFWIPDGGAFDGSRTAPLIARLNPEATVASAQAELAELNRPLTQAGVSLTSLEAARGNLLQAVISVVGFFLLMLAVLGLAQAFSLRRSLRAARVSALVLGRNYGFLCLKAAPLLTILALTWVVLTEWEMLAPLGYFSGVIHFMATFVLLLACVAVVWWSLVDQALRCYLCLRHVRMPIGLGTFGSILFDLPGTEYICTHGHGALYVPAATSEGLQETKWTSPSGFWEDLLRSPSPHGI